jgi:hypothetical protein
MKSIMLLLCMHVFVSRTHTALVAEWPYLPLRLFGRICYDLLIVE